MKFLKSGSLSKSHGSSGSTKLVNILLQAEYSVNELSEHLRLMKNCGFLASERIGTQVFYKVTSPTLPKLLDCISNSCGSGL